MRYMFATLAAAAALTFAHPSWAYAPDPPLISLTQPVAMPVPNLLKWVQGTVVNNWILCTSQEAAVQMVDAFAQGSEAMNAAYKPLLKARTCGQFAEMRVILKSDVHRNDTAQAYSALFNREDEWLRCFVIRFKIPAAK